MASWKLKFKNAGTAIKRGGQLGIETAIKMCPMTVAPYFGYKYLRYGKQGVYEGADIIHQITDTHADIMEGFVHNFHEEPLREQEDSYIAFINELGGYTEGTDYYQVYMDRNEARELCFRIYSHTLTKADSDTLEAIEIGAFKDVRKNVLDTIDTAKGKLPDITLPKIPDIGFDKIKLPSLGIAKYIFLLIVVIIGLIALGYSGVGKIMEREHGKQRE